MMPSTIIAYSTSARWVSPHSERLKRFMGQSLHPLSRKRERARVREQTTGLLTDAPLRDAPPSHPSPASEGRGVGAEHESCRVASTSTDMISLRLTSI